MDGIQHIERRNEEEEEDEEALHFDEEKQALISHRETRTGTIVQQSSLEGFRYSHTSFRDEPPLFTQ